MVANAGVCQYRRIIDSALAPSFLQFSLTSLEVTADDWDRVMSINARGAFLCYKYAGIQMIRQGRGGRIIGASSVGGKRGLSQVSEPSAE